MARIAVSDGASESAFARQWAITLADAFVDDPLDLSSLTGDSLEEWLEPRQAKWRAGVPWDRIPWHGESKTRAGAFATLLGLTIETAQDSSQDLSWRAVAVGDTCLFMVRDDRLCLSFPMEDIAQFGNNPALVCSNPANVGDLWGVVRQHSGECASGDLLILATDALACWFLAQSATGAKPWKTLLALDLSEWGTWVGEQRSAGSMRNDDSTLVIIEVT